MERKKEAGASKVQNLSIIFAMDAESHLKIFPKPPNTQKLPFVNRQILIPNNYPEQASIAIEDVRKKNPSQAAISYDVSPTQKFQNRNIIKL
ncbi:hypothetical protein [Floridanema aerugineum]|jgi:hypothetical protein|uniref:Uncharacterized protein n=1 Tax=Floridaenema aerugineum BLCC-F46 TaxID=3153654 RepID=A0ABV4XIP2_9CYAN